MTAIYAGKSILDLFKIFLPDKYLNSNLPRNYFIRGACSYGENCNRSHDNSLRPSTVCKFALANSCHFEDECIYHHIQLPASYTSLEDAIAKINAKNKALNVTQTFYDLKTITKLVI